MQETETTSSGFVKASSGNDDWRTPRHIVDALHEVFGGIALDPCSQDDNPTRADAFHTKDNQCSIMPWPARDGLIFVNPPYSEMGKWSKIIRWNVDWFEEHQRRHQIVALVKFAPDTRWFQELAERSRCVLAPRRRVQFERPPGSDGGKSLSPPFASAFLCFGGDMEFHEALAKAIDATIYVQRHGET